jgi:hypothetical protein
VTVPAGRPSQRPTLRVVAGSRPTPGRLPFALLVGGILIGGLVALLMLHTLAAQDAFRVHALQQQLSGLTDQEQQLTVTAQQLESPTRLAARARSLGMRPSRVTSYRRLRDGRQVAVMQAPVVAPAPAVTPSSPTPSRRSDAATRAHPGGGTAARSATAHHARTTAPSARRPGKTATGTTGTDSKGSRPGHPTHR